MHNAIYVHSDLWLGNHSWIPTTIATGQRWRSTVPTATLRSRSIDPPSNSLRCWGQHSLFFYLTSAGARHTVSVVRTSATWKELPRLRDVLYETRLCSGVCEIVLTSAFKCSPNHHVLDFNPLKTKCNLFYIRPQYVPRCKHTTLRL
jgi:hypothetical protein